MREFQEKKNFKTLFYSKWTLAALFLVFLFMSHATWQVYARQQKSSEDREKAEKTLALALQTNTTLKEQVDELQTKKGVEEEIRKKYSVSKPGEEVAVIVDDSNSPNQVNPSPVKKNWWQQVLDFFRF